MNQRRQELERTLPPPSQLLCSHLWSKLGEAGIKLSQEDTIFISRVFCDYIQNTQEGKKTTLKLLGATVTPVNIKDAFYPLGNRMPGKQLNHKDLVRYSGYIYKGRLGLSDSHLELEVNGNMEGCDSTGILGPKGYCVQVVKEYTHNGAERLTSLSNYARLHSEDINIRSTANMKVCQECAVKTCDYHPARDIRQQQQLKLLPQSGVKHG